MISERMKECYVVNRTFPSLHARGSFENTLKGHIDTFFNVKKPMFLLKFINFHQLFTITGK